MQAVWRMVTPLSSGGSLLYDLTPILDTNQETNTLIRENMQSDRFGQVLLACYSQDREENVDIFGKGS